MHITKANFFNAFRVVKDCVKHKLYNNEFGEHNIIRYNTYAVKKK